MTLELDLYEQALIERLEPLRVALADSGIPVALLPRKAYSMGVVEEGGHIAIAFPSSEGDLDRTNPNPSQITTIYVEVRISLSDRYNLNRQQAEATVDWSLTQIIGLLVLYKLPVPRVRNALLFAGHQFFRPEDNRWEVMARFVFDVLIIGTGAISSDPPIKQIAGKDDRGTMFVAE